MILDKPSEEHNLESNPPDEPPKEDEEEDEEELISENMVIVQPCPEHKYFMDRYLKTNLDYMKREVLKKDYDAFIIADGMERTGKSTLLMQIAKYVDPDFNLDRVCFTISQFIKAVENAKKGQAILFDETMGYLGSRGAMSKLNRSLIKIFSEMGYKNLFILLAIPSFFELDRYAAIHRSVCLFHVYKRGGFLAFNYSKKKLLYIYGKKFYSYAKPTADFIGSYTKYFPVDKEAYQKKKQEGISQFYEERERIQYSRIQRNKLIDYLNKVLAYDPKKISDICGLSVCQINDILKDDSPWRGEDDKE